MKWALTLSWKLDETFFWVDANNQRHEGKIIDIIDQYPIFEVKALRDCRTKYSDPPLYAPFEKHTVLLNQMAKTKEEADELQALQTRISNSVMDICLKHENLRLFRHKLQKAHSQYLIVLLNESDNWIATFPTNTMEPLTINQIAAWLIEKFNHRVRVMAKVQYALDTGNNIVNNMPQTQE